MYLICSSVSLLTNVIRCLNEIRYQAQIISYLWIVKLVNNLTSCPTDLRGDANYHISHLHFEMPVSPARDCLWYQQTILRDARHIHPTYTLQWGWSAASLVNKGWSLFQINYIGKEYTKKSHPNNKVSKFEKKHYYQHDNTFLKNQIIVVRWHSNSGEPLTCILM